MDFRPETPTPKGSTDAVPPPKRDDVVVIIPAFREPVGLGRVIGELNSTLNPTILVALRSSNDRTEDVARSLGATVIVQPDRGKGNAIRHALDYIRTRNISVETIGLIDADCTYPTEPMILMDRILRSDSTVGMVVGRRANLFNRAEGGPTFVAGNHMLARAHRVLNAIPIADPLSGMRMMRADLLKEWVPLSKGFEIEVELNHYVGNVMQRTIVEVPIDYRQRIGEKKLGVRHGLSIGFRMVYCRLQHPSKSRVDKPRLDGVTAGSAGTRGLEGRRTE